MYFIKTTFLFIVLQENFSKNNSNCLPVLPIQNHPTSAARKLSIPVLDTFCCSCTFFAKNNNKK